MITMRIYQIMIIIKIYSLYFIFSICDDEINYSFYNLLQKSQKYFKNRNH